MVSSGIKLVSSWFQVGFKLVSSGIKLVSSGIKLVSSWFQVGIKLVSSGIKLVSSGIKLVSSGIKWYQVVFNLFQFVSIRI